MVERKERKPPASIQGALRDRVPERKTSAGGWVALPSPSRSWNCWRKGGSPPFFFEIQWVLL